MAVEVTAVSNDNKVPAMLFSFLFFRGGALSRQLQVGVGPGGRGELTIRPLCLNLSFFRSDDHLLNCAQIFWSVCSSDSALPHPLATYKVYEVGDNWKYRN